MAKPISIAIDGPAGAGKSTIARRLAKELGFYYVDTGAIYRTVAYFFDLWGVSPKDIDGITRYIDELTIGIEYDDEGVQHMIMNGMDVTGDIRTPDLSQKASLVSAHAIVRDLLLDMQREMAEKQGHRHRGAAQGHGEDFPHRDPGGAGKAPHGRADCEGTEGGLQ